MADNSQSEDNSCDNDSFYEDEDINEQQDASEVGNDIDDETLFKSFKVLRQMTECISKNMRNQNERPSCSTRNTRCVRADKRANTSGDAANTNALSRCNLRYFRDVIASLSGHQKGVVDSKGFKFLLEFDGTSIPRPFIEWLVWKIDANCMDIHANGKMIPTSAVAVHKVIGTPIGGRDISKCGDDGKAAFLELFKLNSIPTIKTFGEMILKKVQMSDDQFFRCFMVVALSTFLCPNSSTKISPKYLKPLIDVSTIKDWNWSEFIFQWLAKCIRKYKKNKRTLGGCIYFLAVYYLDFLDFGSHSVTDMRIPRIQVWDGRMIKTYISFDRVDDSNFGKRPAKDFADTCYASEGVAGTDINILKKELLDRFRNVAPNLIDGICSRYLTFCNARFAAPHFSPDRMLLDVLQYIYDENDNDVASSQDANHNSDHVGATFNGVDAHNGADADAFADPADRSFDVERNPCAGDTFVGPGSSGMDRSCGAGDTSGIPDDDERHGDEPMPERDVFVGGMAGLNNDTLEPDVAHLPSKCGDHTSNQEANDDKADTEIIDSDGTFVNSGNVPVSQATVILSSQESGSRGSGSAGDTSKSRRRKRKESTPDSSDSIASRTKRRILSRKIGMSPLSKGADESEAIGQGSSRDNPFPIEDNEKDKVIESNSTVEPIKCRDQDESVPIRQPPVWNSPSYPSWRIMDDEDDYGNYIPDPNDRRPFDPISPSKMHSQINVSNQFSSFRSEKQFPYFPNDEDIRHGNAGGCSSEFYIPCERQNFSSENHPCLPSIPEASTAPEVQPTPLAMISSDGDYVDLSQEAAHEQDVTILGERTFSKNLSNMSSDSEKYYNWSYSSAEVGSGSSSGKKPVYRTTRMAVPSRFMSSPFINERAKVSVTAKEREVYRVLLNLHVSQYSLKKIIDYRKVMVTFGALGSSLRPNGVVSSFVVNALCKKMFDKNHVKTSLKHYFFTKVSDFLVENFSSDEKRVELEKHATKCFKAANGAHFLPNSKLLYFPVYFRNHWCVVVVNLERRKFVVLDPCVRDYGAESEFHKRMAEPFKRNFMAMWKQSGKVDMSFEYYTFVFADVPQATKEEDHGIFIMKYLEDWMPSVNLMTKFGQADIPNLRIKLANEMIFYEHNKASDGLDTLKSYDSEVFAKYFEGQV